MSYLRRAFLGFAFGVGGMVLLSVPAQAQNSIIGTVIQGQSGGTPIGGAVGVNCSTNVTCSIVAGILQVSVSGSLFCGPVGSPTANAVLFDNGILLQGGCDECGDDSSDDLSRHHGDKFSIPGAGADNLRYLFGNWMDGDLSELRRTRNH